MVGCGGFGAANTGVAIMERAAAKDPAIVALAKTFFEFMGVILSPDTGRCGDDRGMNTASTIGPPENPVTAGFKATQYKTLRVACR
jgi:hypothetical protein